MTIWLAVSAASKTLKSHTLQDIIIECHPKIVRRVCIRLSSATSGGDVLL